MHLITSTIVKNKKGKIADPNNYRPIAKANIMSKVLENILLEKISPFITSSENQFGYKSDLGTDSCVMVLKEVIAKYHCKNTNVFVAYLDASRAFDRISYPVLFKVLHGRGVPLSLLGLLYFWYLNQEMAAKWGGGAAYPTGFESQTA